MDDLAKLTGKTMPFASELGIEFTDADTKKVVARMEVTPNLCTIPEVLHGGAVMAFADTVGAALAVLNLPEGAWTTTIESKTNFVGAAPVGAVITAEATLVHAGRRTIVCQTRITLENGRLAALVTQTQLVLER